MYAAVDPVNGFAGFDEFARLLVGCFSRIAERSKRGLVLVELLDGGFVGDSEDNLVASLLGLADLPEHCSRRCFGQRFIVAVDVLGVRQLARRAGNAAEKFERRRHAVGGRHVIHQFRGDARILEVLFDQLGIFLVDALRRSRSACESQHRVAIGMT